MKIEVPARTNPFEHGYDVLIRQGDAIVRSLTFETIPPGSMHDPTLIGQDGAEFLRAALNAAWELGLRPDGYEDTRESMRATAAHLADMRQIAFGRLEIEKPEREQP